MTDPQERRDSGLRRAAKALSKQGARQGGLARADRLSPEERSESARQAAEKRWGRSVQIATHDGQLQIGSQILECAVLEDDGRGGGPTRVINQGTLLAALGRARRPKGVEGGGTVLFANNLRPFISPELEASLADTITYRTTTNARAIGFRAELLPAICEVYLDAQQDGKLFTGQKPAAKAAYVLHRGLARVGIIALVDEATGYQESRARQELQRILERYVQAEYRPWMRMFPDEFFKEIYRLQGWEYKPGTAKRTQYVGKLVNKYVYDQLPPGVHDELRRLNPKNDKGNRARRHHQYLTADTGNQHLDKQISTVTTLMRISQDKIEFEELFDRAFPPVQPRLPLRITVSSEDRSDSDE